MDYLKILNVFNNTEKAKPSIETAGQFIKKPEAPEVNQVSVVIYMANDIIPVIEANSIIANIGQNIKIENIYILHSIKNISDSKLIEINHDNVVLKRVMNKKHFNINLIDDIMNDLSEYILISNSDKVLANGDYVNAAIALMKKDKTISKVDSRSALSEHAKLSTTHNRIEGIDYFEYIPNNFSMPDDKPGRTINILNFKGFDFNPGLISKKAIKELQRDHLYFYDFNAGMISRNYKAVAVKNVGFKHEICSNNIKVSFIMQAFLGDYPGARTQPIPKFHRAIESVLENENVEMVIVSDGCEITHREVQKYMNDSRIKYAYVSKTNARMYESKDGAVFYRGVPRQVGIEISTGDIIAYMDSDDVVIPTATKTISTEFYNTGLKHLFNAAWFDQENAVNYHAKMPNHFALQDNKLDILGSKFIIVGVQQGYIHWAPWLHCHVRNLNSKWEDVQGNISEDVVFGQKLATEFGGMGKTIRNPLYIRCHLKGYFDI